VRKVVKLNYEGFLDLLGKRRSIRRFKSEKVPREMVEKIISAGQRAPTGGGTQAYSFVLVSDAEKKDLIIEAIGFQKFMEEAPLWIMICVDWARQEKLWKSLGLEIKFGETTRLFRGLIDAALAAENMVIASEALGLGSVFNGGVRRAPGKIVEILKLPEKVLPVVLLCIGYPDEETPLRPRWPMEAIFHENEYTTPSEDTLAEYYGKSNENMIGMGYFPPGTENWAEHWEKRFPPESNIRSEENLRKELRKLGFLP
jgi:nitroreductase